MNNVEIALSDGLKLTQGNVYIHGDVTYKGPSTFYYSSIQPLQVAQGSTLMFDIGSTFSFVPNTTNKDLFIFQDRTSSLFLNGSTLKTTSSGMRLVRGNLILGNKVSLESNAGGGVDLVGTSLLTSVDYGSGVWSLAWNPSGTVLAIGGRQPAATGGFANTNHVRLYTFNGTTLTPLTSLSFGSSSALLDFLAWNSSGDVLAIGGQYPSSGNELQLYRFNGSTLSLITSVDYGTINTGNVNTDTGVWAFDWNPAGTILAIGGQGPTSGAGGFSNTNELRLYSFNGTTLTPLTSIDYGSGSTSRIVYLEWNPAGNILAVGGGAPADGNELHLYSFNGSTLSLLTGQDYGSAINVVTWNSAGDTLAVGGWGAVGNELKIYKFNGSSLTLADSANFGNTVETIAWDKTGTRLLVGGELKFDLYSFNGSTLSYVSTQAYGTNVGSSAVESLAWHPVLDVLAVGGKDPSNGNELQLYNATFAQQAPSAQAPSNSIIFGNSALGSSYDLNVHVLGGANVSIKGIVMDDSA